MMKKTISLVFALLLACALGAAAHAQSYPDVPEGHWAAATIEKARSYALMEGMEGGVFGLGQSMKRSEFVTVLVRMFGWEVESGGEDAASDIASSWARRYINTAARNGVFDEGGKFRPNDDITRSEMAVMLVRALGLNALASSEEDAALPFPDVKQDRGYIAIAYEIGMTNGAEGGVFLPDGTAKREEAATMLVRVYEKYNAPTTWKHAFYALSSYSQIEMVRDFDAVSVGWSRMSYDEASGAKIVTDGVTGKDFCLPAGYADVVRELRSYGVTLNLNVYMAGTALRDMLASPAARTQAAKAIVSELTRNYTGLGRNVYDGATVDFEGLRAEHRADFIAFLAELSERLRERDLTLYVAVMPAVPDDVYYDGYDFAAMEPYADKIILMAHDYAALDLTGLLRSSYYKNMAPTPINKVFYGIRDAVRAMNDPDKLVLQISVDALAWQVDERGLLTAAKASRPIYTTVYKRLTQPDSEMGWSDFFRDPYLRYKTEEGKYIFLWYEDARSVREKLSCAKLLGATGVSVWRLGLIPDYPDEGLHYDVLAALK